ncbi:hypothetical protein Tsubulata_037162 [Turnera subulata]|uniref:S-adenosylmethionine-dependent methyltransferase At5g38100 n=1 Tax=Turnera subulata TaxID=218843 RepID=A0A9Q0JQL0_9ROSI|nr:hypothetical protein Tsubulata_037162 [Turnera subulata]
MAHEISDEPLAMVGGDGPRSYSKNSQFQRAVADAAKGMITEGINQNLDFKNQNLDFRVADFGCSVGPNTFLAVENIIEAVNSKYENQLHSPNPVPLEFQVFFNDVTSNDFNTLFRTLPAYPKYFAAGVPGSFYGRLFPKSTIHFAHSSSAMHWLSKIPREILDSNSPAWNKGSIHCSGTVKEVVEAYSAQFRSDMDCFLDARAQEMVGGGLMAITILGLPEGARMFQTGYGIFYDLLGSCLNDMAKLGVLRQEQVDSFNLPLYHPYVKELEEIINKNGYFSIQRIEKFRKPLSSLKPSVEVLVSTLRAYTADLFKRHFGEDDVVVDQIYEHFGKKLSDNFSIFDEAKHQHTEIFTLLKRHV